MHTSKEAKFFAKATAEQKDLVLRTHLRCPALPSAIADRCAGKSSLHPPPAALGFAALGVQVLLKLQKKSRTTKVILFFLAGAEGLEPSARGFGDTPCFKRPFKLFPLLSRLWHSLF